MRVAYVASSPACPAVLLWSAVGLIAAFAALALAVSRIHVGWVEIWPIAASVCTIGGLILLQSRIDQPVLSRLIAFLECFNLLAILGVAATLCSYALTPLSGHFVDAALSSFDRSLGLDWMAMYRFVEANQWARVLGRGAYASFFVTPVILLGWLCASGRAAEARTLILVYAIALALTVALYPLSPAMGPFSFYGLTGSGYRPVCTDQHVELIHQIKAALVFEFSSENMAGLISFPSFHCASALIYIWTVRDVRILRWPLIVVNVMMICATPIEGNHYFFDLLGGGAVAILAIYASRAITHWHAHRPMSALSADGDPAFA